MKEDFSAFQIKHKPTDTKEAWIIMVLQTVITHTSQKRRKSNPLKPNAFPDLCLRYICKYFIINSPQLVRDSQPPPQPLQHVPPPAHPPARLAYTSSDGAHETEA
jgi:hypothetical protein